MPSPAVARLLRKSPLQRFIDTLLYISPGNLRALWLPNNSDSLTTLSCLSDHRIYTYDGSIVARVTPQGNGVKVSFDGLANYATTPDTADMSFNTGGSTDLSFSIAVLANVTDTAAVRGFISKHQNVTGEWYFEVDTTDHLHAQFKDQSAGATASCVATSTITQGALHTFGMSYDGTGGATAANGIKLLQDGVAFAVTPTTGGTYVAMEDTTVTVSVGNFGNNTNPASYFQGALGFVAVYAANLSAVQHLSIKSAVNTYYRLAL